MKRVILVLALASLVASTAANALMDDGENSLGIYFDYGSFDVNCVDVYSTMFVDMYFVLANCTEPAIGGFQVGWEFDPDPVASYIILGVIFPPGSWNTGDNYNFNVGCPPYLTAPATPLAQVQILFLSPVLPTDISVGPPAMSVHGYALFADAAGINLYPMNFSTVDGTNVVVDSYGWVRPGVATIGCPGPIANDDATWGSVKSLFR